MKPLAIILSLLLTSTVHAQETAPWPPDPATIFAPGVEVVSVEMRGNTQPTTIEKPMMDTEDRAVIMPDGRAFPWPDEFPYARFYGEPDEINHKLVIAAIPDPQSESYTLWQLDTISGVYAPLEGTTIDTICGPRDVNWRSIGWVRVNNSSHQLCDMSTGTTTTTLPENLITVMKPVESPDGKVLLLLFEESESIETILVGTYHIQADKFEYIGEIKQGGFPQFRGWIANQIAVINLVTDTGNAEKYRLETYTLIDVSTQDVNTIGSFDWIDYTSNYPPSIIRGEQSENGMNISCQFSQYNILAHTTITFHIASACRPEYSVGGNDYYRELSPNQTQATVSQIQRYTGARTTIISGEIEKIVWVSADQRYIGVINDDNGIVDLVPGQRRYNPVPEAIFSLVDFDTNKTLFSRPAAPGGASGDWSLYVDPITSGWLQVFYTWGGDQFNTLLHLRETTADVIPLDGVIAQYFGHGWAALHPRNVVDEVGGVASLGLYNLDTQTTIPVVNIGNIYQYALMDQEFKSIGGDRFQVVIAFYDRSLDTDAQPKKSLAYYTIRVPGVDAPLPP